MIGDSIEVKILDVKEHQVKVGIAAPKDIAVHRKEVYLAIQAENEHAAAPPEVDDISKLIPG